MGLETGTYVSDLVATNPTSGDPKSQGDDHIRLLKSLLLATFPYTGQFYETGTFTPALTFGGGSTGLTYSFRTGVYTRLGNRIDFKVNILLTAKGSSTGNVAITGLPVASSATANTSSNASVYGNALSSISGGIQGLITTGATSITLFNMGVGSAANLTDANFGNASQLIVTGTYFI